MNKLTMIPGIFLSHYGLIENYPVPIHQSIDDNIRITFDFKYKRKLTINEHFIVLCNQRGCRSNKKNES